MKSIAIIIDPWKTAFSWIPGNPYRRCYNNIIKYIESNSLITDVFLANYDCPVSEYDLDNHWYTNSKIVLGEEYTSVLKHKQQNNKANRDTHKSILSWKSSKQQYAMCYPFEINRVIDFAKIDNIFVFGQTWKDCCKNRPLGYGQLFNQKFNYNILTKKDCVLDDHNFYFNPKTNPGWIKSNSKDIYRLISL